MFSINLGSKLLQVRQKGKFIVETWKETLIFFKKYPRSGIPSCGIYGIIYCIYEARFGRVPVSTHQWVRIF